MCPEKHGTCVLQSHSVQPVQTVCEVKAQLMAAVASVVLEHEVFVSCSISVKILLDSGHVQ